MGEALHVIMPADVFPPRSGGAGWSAHALALSLLRRGHRVTAIVPRAAPLRLRWSGERLAPSEPHSVLGVPVVEAPYPVPRLPFVANLYRHEAGWPLIRNVIVREALRDPRYRTVIHAQHVQTVPGAILAGRELGVPVVATVRDHWPRDYFATGLHGNLVPYPGNTVASLATDLVARLGPFRGVLASLTIPYMLSHLRRRQHYLAQADLVIAVSKYVARHLPPTVPGGCVRVVPNIVDVEQIGRVVATPPRTANELPFVLYVGKLERNKGAHLLPEVFATARQARGEAELPELVVAGDGALAGTLRGQFAALGCRLRLLPGWTDHDEVLRLMHQADVLVFPSAWGEPLSRVLLEACAAGACVAAMATGGSAEVIADGENGLLVDDAAALGQAMARLLEAPDLRARLRARAGRVAYERYAPDVVAARFETCYHESLANTRPKHTPTPRGP